MNEKHFDEFSKVLGEGITRRIAFSRAARLFAAVLFGAFGLKPTTVLSDMNSYADFQTLYGDTGWTCNGKSQVLVSQSSSGKLDVVRPVCIFDTKCINKGVAADVRNFLVGCHSVDGICPDFADCANEMLTRETDLCRLYRALPTKTVADPANVTRFGATCKYSWSHPVAMYRHKTTNHKWDMMCATPVTGCAMPDVLKGSFLATCDGIELQREKDGTYLVCPAVQDCLAKAIPAIPTPTVSEAKVFKARQGQ